MFPYMQVIMKIQHGEQDRITIIPAILIRILQSVETKKTILLRTNSVEKGVIINIYTVCVQNGIDLKILIIIYYSHKVNMVIAHTETKRHLKSA